MEFFSGLKNISGEIARSLDSSQGQKPLDENKKTLESDTEFRNCQNADSKAPLTEYKQPKDPMNWGEWEETKATPTKHDKPVKSQSLAKPEQLKGKDSGGTKMATSTTPTKLSKVDELSREELIERVKKQTALLQKMKARSEELNRECNRLKQESAQGKSSPSDEHLLQELQVLKSERDKALAEVKSVKQMITTTDKENQGMIVSLETETKCLRDENSLLKSRIQQMEDERSSKDGVKESELESLTEQLTLCRMEKESALKEMSSAMEVLENDLQLLKEEKEKLGNEKDALSQKMTENQVELRSMRASWDKERTELMRVQEETREQLVNLQEKSDSHEEKMRRMVTVFDEDKEAREKEIENLKRDKEKLATQCRDLKSQVDVAMNERRQEEEKLRSQVSVLVERETGLGKKLEEAVQEKNELEKRLSAMKEERLQWIETEKGNTEHLVREARTQLEEGGEKEGRKDVEKDEVDRCNRETKEGESVKVLQEEVYTLSNSLKEAQNQCEELKREVEKTREANEREKKSLEERCGQLEEEGVSLKEQLKEVGRQEMSRNEEEQERQKEMEDKLSASSEEVRKFKAIAVKMKKELGEAKEKEMSLSKQLLEAQNSAEEHSLLESVRQEAALIRKERDAVKRDTESELNKSFEELKSTQEQLKQSLQNNETIQERVKALNGQLSDEMAKSKNLTEQLNEMSAKKSHMTQALKELESRHSSLQSEHSSVKSQLTAAETELTAVKKIVEEHVAEITSLKEALSQERDLHRETQQKLALLEKEVKSSSLIDLELADYQRSIEALKDQLREKEENRSELEGKIESMTNQNQQIQREMEDVKNDVSVKDEMLTKLKAMLRKSTKELTDSKAQFSETQNAMEELQREIELERQGREEAKVEIATLTAKLQSNANEHQSSLTNQQHLVHSLETKITRLHSEQQQREEELTRLREEHESYKVRVHSVLKQKSTAPSVSEIESSFRQKHETDLLKSRAELKEAKDRLNSILIEHEDLEVEHQQLAARHEQLLIEKRAEKQQLNDRLFEVEGNYRTKTRELEDNVTQLRQETISITQAFKTQIHSLQEAHNEELERLKLELKNVSADLSKLQQEADAQLLARRTTQSQISRENSYHAKLNEVNMSVMPNEERSAGEGMDRDELEGSEVTTPTLKRTNGELVSLERLLSSSSSDVTTAVLQEQGEVDVTLLQNQLRLSSKKTSHLTELLHESEENCVRLADQARLLKEEIRRLERNEERQKEASNMEYMKNVVLKFLHTESSAERAGLIPIITKLLKLSQQEKQFLSETIKGNKAELPDLAGVPSPGGGGAKGWGSYLHRWTGY